MTGRKLYRATAERDQNWWILRVPEINSVTQARRLDQTEFMVRDLIYAVTDEAPDTFDVEITPALEPELSEVLESAVEARGRAASAQEEAADRTKRAAVELHAAGLTVRDVGALLGLTHQRAHQLIVAADRRSQGRSRTQLV